MAKSSRSTVASSPAESTSDTSASSEQLAAINDRLRAAGADGELNVVKITNAYVNITSPGRNFVTLKVETDQGIYGLGDGTLNGRELAVASYLTDHVIPCVIGRNPFDTEDIWQ